jgi:hypothetical protein
VIGSGEGERVNVSSAQVLRETRKESVENVLNLTPVIANNTERKTTEVTMDLGGEGISTHQLTLVTHDGKNFSRRALILESSDGKTWNSIGDGYVFSLVTPTFTGSSLTLSFRESRARYLRVLVRNEDDTPIVWDKSVTLLSVGRSIVFQAEAGKSYALYYGAPDKSAPQYDLARYFQYIEGSALRRAALRYEEMNPGYVPPAGAKIPYTAGKPNLLNAALIILVAVMSFLLISYLKKLKNSPRG